MDKNKLLHLIALSKVPMVGTVKAKNLIAYCGGVEAVFNKDKQELLAIPGIGPKIAESIANHNTFAIAKKELNFIEKNQITTYTYLDHNYPSRLKHHESAPLLLYYQGSHSLDQARTVAIVGTRKPSEYGKAQCEKIVEGLKDMDVTIISGLAYGIDAIAHKKSVQLDIPTIGILGHGLDQIYPRSNQKLAQKMMENGGILSQFTSGGKPDRENFPQRNKVIAGLSDVVVVVESAASGGSMITAQMANDYNKDVFAIPGRLNDKKSEGCNQLIKKHRAALIESADDIAYIMRWDKNENLSHQTKLFVELSTNEQRIMDTLKMQDSISIDQLHYDLELPLHEISTHLLEMEFKGLVRSLPGKRYSIN